MTVVFLNPSASVLSHPDHGTGSFLLVFLRQDVTSKDVMVRLLFPRRVNQLLLQGKVERILSGLSSGQEPEGVCTSNL